jgi:hypothetical protein
MLGHSDIEATAVYWHVPPTPAGRRKCTRKDYRSKFQPDCAIQEKAEARMTRPTVEVADIVRARGGRFTEENAWLTYQHLTALRAIARCRTADLGGHIDHCTKCGHQGVIQFVRKPPLSKSVRRKPATVGLLRGDANCSLLPTFTSYCVAARTECDSGLHCALRSAVAFVCLQAFNAPFDHLSHGFTSPITPTLQVQS